MNDHIMLGLGFVGGLIYLAAYVSLTRGWISGTGYAFHGVSVFSCILVAVSSAYSQAWPSAAMNVVFVMIGAVYLARKAIADARPPPNETVTDAADLTYHLPKSELEAPA
jgi:hypothetical protein